MKQVLFIFIIIICISFNHCCLKSELDTIYVRDTVVYYDDNSHMYLDGSISYNTIPVERLDCNLYLLINTQYISCLYDTKDDTTMRVDIGHDSTYSFIDFFINSYYNHYPLLDNEYRVIKKIVSYIYFYTDWYDASLYSERLNYNKMNNVVEARFEDDTLNRIYSFTLRDTLFDVKANIKLQYIND